MSIDKILEMFDNSEAKDNFIDKDLEAIENLPTVEDLEQEQTEPETKTEEKKRGRPKKNIEEEEQQKTVETKESQQKVQKQVQPEESEDSGISPFVNYFFEKVGWQYNPEVHKFNDVDDFVGFLETVVEENSRPKYSSQLVQDLDEYIANGGDYKDFLNLYNSTTEELGVVNLEDQRSQAHIVTKWLKETTQWTDDKIRKYINTAAEKGILKEEAIEAYQGYKEMKAQEYQQQIQQQKEQREVYEKQTQEKLNLYVNTIDKATEVTIGYGFNAKEKEAFKKFLFETNESGVTPYSELFKQDPLLELKLAAHVFKNMNSSKSENNNKDKALNMMKSFKGKTNQNSKHDDLRDNLDVVFDF
jgi:hypothetical protein